MCAARCSRWKRLRERERGKKKKRRRNTPAGVRGAKWIHYAVVPRNLPHLHRGSSREADEVDVGISPRPRMPRRAFNIGNGPANRRVRWLRERRVVVSGQRDYEPPWTIDILLMFILWEKKSLLLSQTENSLYVGIKYMGKNGFVERF